MKTAGRAGHLPLMVLALLALLAGLWAGLVRIGWAFPPLGANWVANHGPLMISGFLGTLISLERAVALAALGKVRWPYVAPLLAGLGGLAILAGLPDPLGRGLIVLGSLGLVAIFVVIFRRSPTGAHAAMGLGALLWLAGNGLWWLGQPVYHSVPWWVGFLVLTVAGERLELARLLRLRRAALITFASSLGLYLAGLFVSLGAFGAGVRLSGVGLLTLGLWLLRYDIARMTIRQTGLTRFIAACLLPGYVWLMFAGGLWLWWADQFVAGPVYDAMLHSLLLGYVISMIFGHAPIIVPAVLGVALTYRPAFYVHLVLLHIGLVMRVAGDLSFNPSLRMWGGMLNVVAILAFLGTTVWSARSTPAVSLVATAGG